MHRQMVPKADPDPDLSSYDWELIVRAREYRDSVIEGYPIVEHEIMVGPVPLADDLDESLWPHGTADLLAMHPKHSTALILDYKFGPNPLDEAMVGPQQISYALGVFANYLRVKSVDMRVYHVPQDEEFSALIRRTDGPKWAQRVSQIVRDGEAPRPALVPARNTCPWCRGRTRCPQALSMVKAFQNLPHITDLTPLQKGELYARCEVALSIAKKIRRELIQAERTEKGSVALWRLKRVARRKIPDTGAALMYLKMYLDPNELYNCTKVLVAKAEDAWSRKYAKQKDVTLKEAKKVFMTNMRDLVEWQEPTYWLVPRHERKEVEGGDRKQISGEGGGGDAEGD